MESVDQTRPAGPWQFDAEVTQVFDDMLQRSIPQYEVMRRTTFELAGAFVRDGDAIVDLGCSRGEALAPFVSTYGGRNHYLGIEVSEPMLVAARKRFANEIAAGLVDIQAGDLRSAYPSVQAGVTLCVLTLQFTPIEYRQRIVRSIWHHTRPGGAVLLVEKVLGSSAELDALMVERYYTLKAANGYTTDQIERKRMALEGVLVPVTARWNEDLLRSAGFDQVECFWRWMNFCGWVGVRDG